MKSTLATFYIFSFSQAFSQTICNQTWEKQTGNANPSLDWSVSVLDESKNLIIAGNNQSTNGQGINFLITKFQGMDGTILWEKEWNYSAYNLDDYCTAISVTQTGVFVCGASTTQNGMTDVVVLKLDPASGNVLWQYIYGSSDGLADIPTDIKASDDDGVFVTGFVTKLVSQSDYLTFHLDKSNGNLIWQSVYNYNNHYDAGARLTLTPAKVYVTGASGTTWADAEITTISYDRLGGSQLSLKKIPNPSQYIDRPTAIATDANGNIYVCGQVKNLNNIDIKIAMFDDQLEIVWQHSFDGGGYDDVPTALVIDPFNGVWLTGYLGKNGNGYGLALYKFDEDGNLILDKSVIPENDYNIKGYDIDFGDSRIGVTGIVERYGVNKGFMYLLNSGGETELYQEFLPIGNSETGRKIFCLDNNDVRVTGTRSVGNIHSYFSKRFDLLALSREPRIINDIPVHHKHELVCRFKTSVLNIAVTDNKDIRFTTIQELLKPTAKIAINTALGKDCKDWKLYKIHPKLTSANMTMINASGHEVEMPLFYTWYTLVLPNDQVVQTTIPILHNLQTVFMDVSYNEIVVTNDIPNDAHFLTKQFSLNESVNSIPTWIGYDIDLDEAWGNFSVGGRANADGGSNTLVAVFDTGANEEHEDLNIVEGYDYFGNSGAATIVNPQNDGNGHGTRMTGIIGASRNNTIGVAGIAGGDVEHDIAGCQLYNYKVFGDQGEPNGSVQGDEPYWTYMNIVFQAYIEASAILNPEPIDIYNNSWGYWDGTTEDPQYGLFEEAAMILMAVAQVGAVSVASMGNENLADVPHYPSNTQNLVGTEIITTGQPEEWVLAVGASDVNGHRRPTSNYGYPMDFIAPGDPLLIYSTNNDGSYNTSSGTSAACAHTTGVIALMHDYLTWSPDSEFGNSIPVVEDYENILERSAFDVVDMPDNGYFGYQIGPDAQSANGMLNAYSALQAIKLPDYKLWHHVAFGPEVNYTFYGEQTLDFNGQYNNDPDLEGFFSQAFVCDVYQLNAYINHNIGSEMLIDCWPLHSQSNTFDYFDDQVGDWRMYQFPYCNLQAFTETAANLRGYTFFIKHPADQPGVTINEWYPIEPSEAQLAYTAYTTTANAVTENFAERNATLTLYPNPAQSIIQLKIANHDGGELDINIFDAAGKQVETQLPQFNRPGNYLLSLPLENLSSGLYLLQMRSSNQSTTLKFQKQ